MRCVRGLAPEMTRQGKDHMDPLPTRWGPGKGRVGFVREKLRPWQTTFGLRKAWTLGRESWVLYIYLVFIFIYGKQARLSIGQGLSGGRGPYISPGSRRCAMCLLKKGAAGRRGSGPDGRAGGRRRVNRDTKDNNHRDASLFMVSSVFLRLRRSCCSFGPGTQVLHAPPPVGHKPAASGLSCAYVAVSYRIESHRSASVVSRIPFFFVSFSFFLGSIKAHGA